MRKTDTLRERQTHGERYSMHKTMRQGWVCKLRMEVMGQVFIHLTFILHSHPFWV